MKCKYNLKLAVLILLGIAVAMLAVSSSNSIAAIQNSHHAVQANIKIITDKDIFLPSEQIILRINDSSFNGVDVSKQHDLWISSPSSKFKYVGSISFPISFNPKSDGKYKISLVAKSSGAEVSSKAIYVGDTPEDVAGNFTSGQNQTRGINASSNLSLSNMSINMSINISTNNSINNSIINLNNSINASNASNQNTEADRLDCSSISISMAKKEFLIDEGVQLYAKGYDLTSTIAPAVEIKIYHGQKIYRLIGSSLISKFFPYESGAYRLELVCSGKTIQNIDFNIFDSGSIYNGSVNDTGNYSEGNPDNEYSNNSNSSNTNPDIQVNATNRSSSNISTSFLASFVSFIKKMPDDVGQEENLTTSFFLAPEQGEELQEYEAAYIVDFFSDEYDFVDADVPYTIASFSIDSEEYQKITLFPRKISGKKGQKIIPVAKYVLKRKDDFQLREKRIVSPPPVINLTYQASYWDGGGTLRKIEVSVLMEGRVNIGPLKIYEEYKLPIKYVDSKGRKKNSIMKIKHDLLDQYYGEDQDSQETQETQKLQELQESSSIKTVDAEIELSEHESFKDSKITFENLKIDVENDIEIRIESLNPEKYNVNENGLLGTNVLKAYALDFSNLNFSNGTYSAVAAGRELWKCAQWDYNSQICTGTWKKIMNLAPGKYYEFEISPEDPGYAETGVATINTRKPAYLPGEDVEIYAAVIDTQGYLVRNADVAMSIMSPGNSLYVYDSEDVEEVQKGIYRIIFNDAFEEGNYSIGVYAFKSDENAGQFVNFTMNSTFLVSSSYEFDIIRTLPFSTDPFKGPFYAQMNITPRISAGNYNLTEMIPKDAFVLDAGGGTVYEDSISKYIKWTGLEEDSSVNYVIQPPLRTPDLMVLGKAIIEYMLGSAYKLYEEFRNWLIAIDPEVTRDQGLVVYGDRTDDGFVKYRNWTGTTLQPEFNSNINAGNRISWQDFTCMETYPHCLLVNSDAGADINFALFNSDSWTWSNYTQLDGSSLETQKNFDIGCEDNSGECIIAYEDSTGGDATFSLRTWNGSTLSGATSITVSGAESDDFRWISLFPKKGSDIIGIALQNEGGGTGGSPAIYGGIWNGSSFVNWQTFTLDSPSQGTGRTNYRHFDCAWEGGTGKFICAYGLNGVNTIAAYSYNGTWSDLGRIYNGTSGEVLEVVLCGQKSSNSFSHSMIGMMMCDEGSDLDGGIWNGTKFSKSLASDNPAENTNAECGANKDAGHWALNFACEWEDSGTQGVFLWVDNNNDYLTYGIYTESSSSFSNPNWDSGTQIVADGAGDVRQADLVSNPASDKIFMIYTDGSRDGGCTLWTGSSWDGSGCNNSAVFETDGPTVGRGWMTFDWFRNPPPQPEISIIRPNNSISITNFSGIVNPSSTSKAYNGSSTALPPGSAVAPITGTEASSVGYVNMSNRDNVKWSSLVATSGGLRAYQSFNFSVPESTVSMSSLIFYHEGRATEGVAQANDDFHIYFYNWSSDSYVMLKTVYASSVDVLSEITLSNGFSDFIRERSMPVLIEGNFSTGAGGSARAELMTNFIGMHIESIPVLSRNQTINASAVDDDGIGFCEWRIQNSTYTGNTTRMSYSSGDYYINITDTRNLPDGFFTLVVFCNDTNNNRRNDTQIVRIDNTPPLISLLAPNNATNLTVNHAQFSWNTTDLAGENMICNLTIDGIVRASNVVSTHGSNATRNITSIADGTHYWNVSCTDDAGNANISETRVLDTDTTAPAVSLIFPSAGAYTNRQPLDLNFSATDSHSIVNCSLYLDGSLNSTIYNVASGTTANFTLVSVPQGVHTWNVSCFDSFNIRGYAATRNFTYDVVRPNVFLNISSGFMFNGTTPVLNYTVLDNTDTNLTCFITVNNVVELSNIPSINNTLVSRTLSLLDGFKQWNVTCSDDAGNSNVSETRLFQVVGGPLVTLQVPKNGTVNNGINVNFTYYSQDGNGIANCSMYFDGVLNQTNSSIINGANNSFYISNVSEGSHTWRVSCFDTNGYNGDSSSWIVISDKTKPTISLSYPSIGQVLNTTPTYFNFTLLDQFSPNATCNLTVDGNISSSNQNFVALNGSITTRSQTITNGFHHWNVTCRDPGLNFNTSLTWNFTVNVTFPVNVTVISDKRIYQEGELAKVNVTARNETNGLISTNMTLDYIYTNNTFTDVKWWNTSWLNRKPVFVNNTNSSGFATRPMLVNVTVPYGTISSCSELRVVNDITLSEVTMNVISGDDVTHCYIYFIGDVSGSASNENNYHVYYNNPSGGISRLVVSYEGNVLKESLVYDAFTGPALSTTAWTISAGWDASNSDPLTGDHAHIDGDPVITDATVRRASSLNISHYDEVNVSFTYAIDGSWDAGEYLRYDYSNDSGSTWTSSAGIGTLNGGAGAASQTVTNSLNASYRINGFNIRFRATANNGNEDGGFDNFNITGWLYTIPSVNLSVGNQQTHIQRITNTTSLQGLYQNNFTTTGRANGNYSAVAYAYMSSSRLRDGSGYYWFNIIRDQFGPVITLIYPGNLSTLRSGAITLNYTAVDYANDVANCSLYIDGLFNQSNSTTVNESLNNTFTVSFGEGAYSWFVSCFDTLGIQSNSSRNNLTIDDTPPNVVALTPNATVVSAGNVTFTYNITDNFDTQILCNLSVDDYNYSALFNATPGLGARVISNISLGNHYWNITCWDNINNTGYSQTLNFSAQNVPSLWLDSPVSGYGINSTVIQLFYNLSSANVDNCSLMLNGQYNETRNSSQIPYKSNDGVNNFTLADMAYGRYTWTVICFDNNGFNGTDASRIFYLDDSAPQINLSFPVQDQTVYSLNINFTFNVSDIDDSLVCNLTIDGAVNRSNVNITSPGTNGIYVAGLSVTNHTWSVSCLDSTGFSTSSETRNFTVDSNVQISLSSPAEEYTSSTGNVSFVYTPNSPAGFSLGFCELYIDDTSYQTHVALTSGLPDTFVQNNIIEGRHSWYINCTDNVGRVGTSHIRNLTVDKTAPSVVNHYPDGNFLANSSVFFNWTATDNIDQTIFCSVRVNGTLQTPGSISSSNNSATNYTYAGFRDGIFFWNVTCVDDASNSGTSPLKNFTVSVPPTVSLNSPSNNSRSSQVNQTFTFTPTDNSGNISACTIFIDGTANMTNTTATGSGAQRSFNITNLPGGNHNWSVNCSDPSGNTGYSITRYFYIDIYPPSILLYSPYEGEYLNSNNVVFVWNVSDYNGTTINCSLYVDGTYRNSTSGLSNTSLSRTVYNLSDGPHNWSVACTDDVGNTANTGIGNFTINQPDLFINTSRIFFNNTNPNENDTINITVNVSNLGGVPASNIIVEFWDGPPETGTIIGNDTGTVPLNGSRIFSTRWNISLGYHAIWVLADPYNYQGELNESNNNATKNISVLRSIINSPVNGSYFNYQNITFNFTAQDFTGLPVNYTVFVNGVANGQRGQTTDGIPVLLNISPAQGVRTIIIEAMDNLSRRKNSTPIVVIVDYTSPVSTINTPNLTWFNYSNPQINISVSDNFDQLINFTMYVDNSVNIRGSVNNATPSLVNLFSLVNGTYSIILEGNDDLNNSANTTTKIIYVDTVRPSIQLNYPASGQNFTSSSVQLNYTVYDNMAANATCMISINENSYGPFNSLIGNVSNFTMSNIGEGVKAWNVSCLDQALNYNISETRTFNVFKAPVITLISPANNSWIRTSSYEFVFNVSDDTGIQNCSLIIDDAINATKDNSQIILNSTNNFTATGLNGRHTWAIECFDNTSLKTYSINGTRNIYADLFNPVPSITTGNATWFRTHAPQISFNITDNMDSTLNYTFFVNETRNANGTVSNSTPSTANLFGLVNGTYFLTLEGLDEAGNSANSSLIQIFVDTVRPSISLEFPLNDTNYSVQTLDLNFTPSDNLAQILVCNLTFDGTLISHGMNVSNGQTRNVTLTSISGGFHYWNVSCIDQAGNLNVSNTYRFYVTRPDISVNSSEIYVSNADARENQTINITAIVRNIGTSNSGNFMVQFWSSNPNQGLRQINGNFTLNLTAGESRNFTVNFTVPIGNTEIFVHGDTPIATNGSIQEENESNNVGSVNVSVALWHYAFGKTGDSLVMNDALYGLLYDWWVDNSTGSNIMAIDSDSNVNWRQLAALTRDTSNNSVVGDFDELDLKLDSANFSDSINRTYAVAGSGAPRETRTYSVYNRIINNVPIVNSTNNSNFKTGILWDYSDGGTEYNGSQDVVFISTINPGTLGYNETTDFEIRVPATLREYKGANNQNVDFYMEIK